jgi:hypothetical protein
MVKRKSTKTKKKTQKNTKKQSSTKHTHKIKDQIQWSKETRQKYKQ